MKRLAVLSVLLLTMLAACSKQRVIKRKIERLDIQHSEGPAYDKGIGCEVYYDNWMSCEDRYLKQTQNLHEFFFYDTEN